MKKTITSMLIITALVVVPTLIPGTAGNLIGTPKASAASCVRYWNVVWSYAGIYAEPSTASNVRKTLSQGGLLCQTSRSAPAGWIYMDNGAYPYYGYVRQAALQAL